ncbi:MAG: hypothetical protein HW410_79 [Nitrosarchaeum sp.]|nr:hypothetical protein [Nitrosarchaeum sp.]
MENKDSIQLTVQDSTWIQTPIRDFGFKCVMNQHDFCNELKCACLCHHKKLIINQDKELFEPESKYSKR